MLDNKTDKPKMMRAIKRNNPLNIRYNDSNRWLGQVANDRGFVVFDTANHGWRAAFKLLNTYIRKGYNTPEKIVRRWAPPSENDTMNYVAYVLKNIRQTLGVGAAYHIMQPGNEAYFLMVQAMAMMEQAIAISTEDLKSIYDEQRVII